MGVTTFTPRMELGWWLCIGLFPDQKHFSFTEFSIYQWLSPNKQENNDMPIALQDWYADACMFPLTLHWAESNAELSLWIKENWRVLRESEHKFLFTSTRFQGNTVYAFSTSLKRPRGAHGCPKGRKPSWEKICLIIVTKLKRRPGANSNENIWINSVYKFTCQPGGLSSRGFWWFRCCFILFLPLVYLEFFFLLQML